MYKHFNQLIKRNTVFSRRKNGFNGGDAHSIEIKHIMCHMQLCHLVGEI